MSRPALIAADWGTSRLRAFLLDGEGAVLERRSSDDGIATVPPGGFPAALERLIAPWLDRRPGLQVTMAGMVGSRNGWIEAPYVPCPASFEAIAAAAIAVPLPGEARALIMPGLMTRDKDGVPDVLRGEETKLAGVDIGEGVVVMPGTHSKWAWLSGGRIEGFVTFMTGDVFAALSEHTLLAKLADTPADPAGFGEGLAASARPGGLTHLAFAARTRVLLGDMAGTRVAPYLSGLLIGLEVAEGLAFTCPQGPITLIAEGVFADHYGQALLRAGRAYRLLDPEIAFIGGLRRLAGVSRSGA